MVGAEQTIFYILASIFLSFAIIFMCVVAYYFFVILFNISKLVKSAKETGEDIKEKTEELLGILGVVVATVEKFVKVSKGRKSKK